MEENDDLPACVLIPYAAFLITLSTVGRGGFGCVVKRSFRVDRAAARTLSGPGLPNGFLSKLSGRWILFGWMWDKGLVCTQERVETPFGRLVRMKVLSLATLIPLCPGTYRRLDKTPISCDCFVIFY